MNNKSRRFVIAAALAITATLTASAAYAQRALRIDSGDPWDNFNAIDDATAAAVATGLGVDFLGADLSKLAINRDGSVSLLGGGVISPFKDSGYDPTKMSISFSRTDPLDLLNDPTLLPAGIKAGFRVNWEYGDAADATSPAPNVFQLSLYELLVGTESKLAMEFNFESVLFGGASSFSGYSNGANNLDLFATISGLIGAPYAFADASGANVSFVPSGDFPFTMLCPLSNANALACNNYSSVSGLFGNGAGVLPTTFNNYFSVNQSFLDPVVGRYFFLFDAKTTTPPPVDVPEPGTLLLLTVGVAGVLLAQFRRRSRVR